MNTAIKTNRLKYVLECEKIEELFDIFVVNTTKKDFKLGVHMLDVPTLENSVQSVTFERSNRFYIMMSKNTENFNLLKQVLLNSADGNTITFSKVSCNSLKKYILLQLLLNAIPYVPSLKFNNLTKHLYWFHPEWLKKSSKNIIQQVPCLKIEITLDCKLKFSLCTFTLEISKDKKRFEKYDKYVFSTNNTLRLKLKSDSNEQAFILKQTLPKKNTIPFMDISNISKFKQSKMGVLAEIISAFNNKYKDFAKLDFSEIEKYVSIENNSTFKDKNKEKFKQVLKGYNIKIIDCIGDNHSAEFCTELVKIFKDNYDITATLGKRLSKKHLNIRVIHNEKYYEGGTDAYLKNTGDYIIQHITIEDYPNSEATATTIAHELVIKNDISRKKISLFNWESLNLNEDISFGTVPENNDPGRYFFMTIHPNGSFEIEEKQLDLFNFDIYTECVQIFKDNHGVKGIIRFGNGDINIIKDTDMFTIPEITYLHDQLKNGNTALRNKEKRDEYLTSVIDIKCYTEGDCQYYFVGTIGAGMQSKIDHASLIRCISPHKDSTLRFDELLTLMNVTFVRNNQLTVIPFPFKYLREYINFKDISSN